MKAVDTNVVLRLITGDDPKQEAIARDLIASTDVFVSLTVLMETEWVLRSFYRWRPDKIGDALVALAGLQGICIERVDRALWAIDRMRTGADFADMIHLLVAADVESFVTFDRDIAPLAGASAPLLVETLG